MSDSAYMKSWRVVQQREGYYVYNDTDLEVCKFLREQLKAIIQRKYGFDNLWAGRYAELIVDEASDVVLDMSQEVFEQRKKDESDDYIYW